MFWESSRPVALVNFVKVANDNSLPPAQSGLCFVVGSIPGPVGPGFRGAARFALGTVSVLKRTERLFVLSVPPVGAGV